MIGLLRFIFVKEVVTDKSKGDITKDQTTSKLSMAETMQTIKSNKYFFILIGMYLLINIVNNLGTVNTYYFKYIYGNLEAYSMVSMTAMATLVFLIIYPMLCKKFNNTQLMRGFFLMGLVGTLIRTIGGTNMATIMVGTILFVSSNTPIGLMINTYLIDCMDYGEWKTGIRIEGLLASINNFMGKIGQALASGIVGFVTGLAGYDGSLTVQSASANFSIVFLYNIFPLILFAIMYIMSRFYNLDKDKPQMHEELKARREGI